MLFGRYPFCDRTLVGLFIKIGRCRPDIPRAISIKARSLLRSLIRVKPDEPVSYTHLDVYKRQALSSKRKQIWNQCPKRDECLFGQFVLDAKRR